MLLVGGETVCGGLLCLELRDLRCDFTAAAARKAADASHLRPSPHQRRNLLLLLSPSAAARRLFLFHSVEVGAALGLRLCGRERWSSEMKTTRINNTQDGKTSRPNLHDFLLPVN